MPPVFRGCIKLQSAADLLSVINLPSVGEILVKYDMIGLIKTCQYDTNTVYENSQVPEAPVKQRRTIMEMRFFKCKICGQMVAVVKKTGCPVVCCGEPMEEIIAGTTDAAVEKHVPVFEVEGNKVSVTVGAAEHPMIPEHYIEWIALQTKNGNQRKALNPGEPPKACFMMCDGDEVEAVYAYCNLHSLWKAE